ncbi:MAG: alcohol dehydrogenase catalytic domain-containing protein [Spirochaetota bacterium]
MKAMVLTEYNRPLEYQDVEDPRPGDHDIVLKVGAAGLCATDIKIASGRLSAFITLPHIPGHEIAGEIVEKGNHVSGLEIGQHGIAYPIISCGRCVYCLTGNENLCINTSRLGFEEDGGFAEYVKVPEGNFCPFNPDQRFEHMAILPDAVGTPYHAFTKIARPKVGSAVLIIGAGGLGLHAVQLAKLAGSRVIVCDVRDESLEAAKSYGADVCLNVLKTDNAAEVILEATGGQGLDIVLEGVGKQATVSLGLTCLKKQGTLIVMGYDPAVDIVVPFIDLHNRELNIAGTKICTRQDLIEVISLVEQGLIRPVVSGTMPLTELNAAYDAVREQKMIGRICIKG